MTFFTREGKRRNRSVPSWSIYHVQRAHPSRTSTHTSECQGAAISAPHVAGEEPEARASQETRPAVQTRFKSWSRQSSELLPQAKASGSGELTFPLIQGAPTFQAAAARGVI